jgi:hypothetical protein
MQSRGRSPHRFLAGIGAHLRKVWRFPARELSGTQRSDTRPSDARAPQRPIVDERLYFLVSFRILGACRPRP